MAHYLVKANGMVRYCVISQHMTMVQVLQEASSKYDAGHVMETTAGMCPVCQAERDVLAEIPRISYGGDSGDGETE